MRNEETSDVVRSCVENNLKMSIAGVMDLDYVAAPLTK